MSNSNNFHFKQFTINQDRTAMKVGIDSVLLGSWCPCDSPLEVLDIGTGTGILALMMAQRSQANIDAVELDKDAFEQATENIAKSSYNSRISVYATPIQDFTSNKSYDIIISNPPYFENSLKSTDEQRNKARHTDTLSFDALCEAAARLLKPEGTFALILPTTSKESIIDAANEHHLFAKEIVEIKGKENKIAKRILISFTKTETVINRSELSIRNAEGRYSKEFETMTKDFYLDSIFR